MLAEKVMTAALRVANRQVLSLSTAGRAELPSPVPGKQYMLYVHIPFCEQLCPYCSFNRYPFDEELARAYFRDLRQEMRMIALMGYDFGSAYFGGGTPTVLIDELVATIDLARELFDIQEVSSETNPNHLIPEIVEPLASRVQRFSIGVQSFDDDLLRQMDRYDKYGSGEETLERLRAMEGAFHSLNVDMIYNFPSQTMESLARDIECVKKAGSNQTTFYPLMTSPVVRRSLEDSVGKIPADREYDYYRAVTQGLGDTFEASSAWTFSRVGGGMIDEYIVDYEDYVGIGSGSFSYIDGTLFVNTFSLKGYAQAIAEGRPPTTGVKAFTRRERMAYRFMMDLFGLELDKRRFEKSFGVPVERGLTREYVFMKLAGAFDADDEAKLSLSPTGRYLLVAMMREFFVGVNAFRDQARAALPEEERALLIDQGEVCTSFTGHNVGV